MLKKNEIWQACITPNDGIDDGATACSNNLTMANTAPTQGTTILNSTLGTNFATENLTVYNQSTADADGDKVTNIISWNRNATPIMMLYMPFDTNYSNHSISNITRDYSGLGHNGSGGNQDAAKSPKWNSSCMSGGCYKFDGSNDFIMLPATADFDTQRPTIEMWVYSNNYAQSGMIFEKTTNGAINTQYSIYFTGSSLYWQTYNTLSQIDDLIVSLATLGMSNSQWYHLTFIYNGTAKAIYVNGIQKGQAAYTQTLITNKAGTSIIGGSGSGTNPSYWYSGYIDELKLYNNTLTPEQIRINYNNSNRISSSSIKVNEVWQACITPNDGSDDGITTCSNNLTVIAATVNSAPNITEINITPSPANASSNLNCNFIITNSEESDSLSANVTWLNGGSIYKGYNISVTNGTQNVHVLQAANISRGNNWTCSVLPYDGSTYGTTKNASAYIYNVVPTQGTPILNSSSNTNMSNENLTVYNISTADADNDKVTNIISWNRNATPIMMLYMPFDTNYSNHSISNITRDYSGLKHNGTGGNHDAAKTPKWNSTCMSGGCYKFDGSNDFIMLPATADFDSQRPTIEMWVYSNNYAQTGMIFEKTTNGATNTQYSVYFGAAGLYWQTMNSISQLDSWVTSLATLGMSNSQWYHLTFIYNGTAKAIYVNGIQKAQTAYTQTLITNKAGTSILGGTGSGTGGTYWYTGYIDEFKLYNNTLTPDQIRINYNNSNRMSSSSIKVNEVWQACITPNDGTDDGTTSCSNNLTILNTQPTQGTPILNSSSGTNRSNENLTVYNISTADADGDRITNLIDWRKNSISDAVLNMPFNLNGSVGNYTNVKDYTTYGNNGSLNGARWNASCGAINNSGGCYEFNSNRIGLGDDSDLEFTSGDFTVSAWIKVNAVLDGGPATHYEIVAKESYQSSGWLMRVNQFGGPGYLLFRTSQSGADTTSITSSAVIRTGEWFNVVIMKKGSDAQFFVNGTQAADDGASMNSPVGGNVEFYIGGAGQSFNGSIDQLQIYNRSLSNSEISMIYNKGKGMFNKIHSNATARDEVWQACITPNDALEDGTTLCSNNLTILNTVPTQGTPILNSTLGTNKSSENLTVYNVSTADFDDDKVTNIINWNRNGTSIMALNMPFERNNNNLTHIKDYSGNENNGTNYSAVFNATGGHDGKGAFEFNGVNGYIGTTTGVMTQTSLCAWVKPFTTTDGNNIMNLVSGTNIYTYASKYVNTFQVYDGVAWRS